MVKKINPNLSEFFLHLSPPEIFDQDETFEFEEPLDEDNRTMLKIWATEFNSHFIM